MHLRKPLFIALALGVVCLALFEFARLGSKVIQQLDRVAAAQTDNAQFSINQAEVEYLKLVAALQPGKDGIDTRNLRDRYDVFYGRVATFQESPLYAVHRAQASFTESLQDLENFLDETVIYIDTDDDVLLDNLGVISDKAREIADPVRSLSLTAIEITGQQSQLVRSEFEAVLEEMGTVTLVLVILLVVGIVIVRLQFVRRRALANDYRLERDRTRAMVQASLDAILVTDPTGQIVECSENAERIFGRSAEDIKSRMIGDLIVGTNKGKTFTHPENSGLMGKGRVQTCGIFGDGEEFPIEIALERPQVADKNSVYVAFVRDITERLAAISELRSARDKARAGEDAKARLLAVMSHEMRTPLNGILGTVELMSQSKDASKQAGFLSAMRTSGELLLAHVNDVLELSRLDSGASQLKVQSINLRHLVHNLVTSQSAYALARRNVIEIQISETVPELVLGDEQKLQQTLLNLLGNAIKFTEGGQIEITVDQISPESEIEFRISDTGIGISDTEIDHIFEDFYAIDSSYARKHHGTGLGLGITKRLVEHMGGKIGAESFENEGSLFWVKLPLPSAPQPNLVANEIVPNQPLPHRTLSVLLVEDNEINRLIAREMLTNLGHQVVEAFDGASAVIKASITKFDLILMDISMPGMDGMSATRKIRSYDGPSQMTPIIALTAHTLKDDLERIQSAGITKVLTKPLVSSQLSKMLDAVVMEDAQDFETTAVDASVVLRDDVLEDLVQSLGIEPTEDLFDKFIDDMDAFWADIASSNISCQAKADRAHSLCGAAAVLGLIDVQARLSELENTLSSGSDVDVADLQAAIETVWTTSRHQFEVRLRELAT